MGKRILIAEDNLSLAKGLTALLQRRSFEVVHQANGVNALKAIATSPPDLLLLDLRLPGLHGIELLKKLRSSPRTAKLPVIIMSGAYLGEKYHQAARSLGVEHYLEKPFKAANIMTAIETLLGASDNPQRPVSHYLQQAYQKGFSGQLLLEGTESRRTLVFVKGAPVSLRPGFAHRDFGDYLRSRKLLNDVEYEHFSTTGGFRHESLVALGCLNYTDLLQVKLDYLRDELEQAFGAPPATASWQEFTPPELMQVITLNVPNLFYHGFRRFPDPAAKRILARYLNHYPVPAGDFYQHINFFDLNSNDKLLLNRMDGQTTLTDCLDDSHDPAALLLSLLSLNMLNFSKEPAEPLTVDAWPLRTLFNAIETTEEPDRETPLESFNDLVDDEPEAPVPTAAKVVTPPVQSPSETPAQEDLAQSVQIMAQSLKGKNHYEVFGIKQAKFSIGLLKERYFAITRQYGPEVLMQLGGEEAGLVEGILSTVATAYDTLSDVVKKERYDELLNSEKIGLGQEGDDRFQAQVQAESGKVFIEMQEWDNAEQALKEAVACDPNNGEVLAHLAWSISRNPRYAESQAMQGKAKQMLNKALTMERTAVGFAYKGWLLMGGGQDVMAEAEFNKALKLDARHSMARQGLRSIREKQEQQKKGLFKRMFK